MDISSLSAQIASIDLEESLEPANKTSTSLGSLPDETLLLIFSLEPLDYIDLKRLSRVCRRFRDIEKVSLACLSLSLCLQLTGSSDFRIRLSIQRCSEKDSRLTVVGRIES